MQNLALIVALSLLPALPASQSAVESEPPETSDDPILRGPDVADDAQQSLVRVTMQGQFIALQERPEEAAINLLVLEPEARQEVRQIIRDRRTELGMFLVDRVDTVREITDAMMSGDQENAEALSRGLYDSFDPTHELTPLLKPLADVMNDDNAAELQRLVDEYWQTRIDWELRNGRAADDRAHERVKQRLALQGFQQELREAYTWTLQPFRQRLEAIYQITEPTDDQRQEIRDAVIDYIRETRLEPSDQQRRALARRLYDVLDESQRLRVFEQVLMRW